MENKSDHLHDVTKMMPLTEEQLKKKIGDPVFIKSERRAEWMILWGYHPPEVYGRAFVFTRRTAQKELFPFSELGVTWNAYAYHPANIGLEAWTAEWRELHGDKMVGLDDCGDDVYRHYHYSVCTSCGKGSAVKTNFCPVCGKSMTPEARAMLEKRLRG